VGLLVLGTLAGDKFIKGLLQLRLCRFLVVRLMLTHDVIQAPSAAVDLQYIMFICILKKRIIYLSILMVFVPTAVVRAKKTQSYFQ